MRLPSWEISVLLWSWLTSHLSMRKEHMPPEDMAHCAYTDCAFPFALAPPLGTTTWHAYLAALLAMPFPCLVIRTAAQRELKAANPTGQFPIHLRVSVQSVVYTTTLLLIQHNLQHLTSILLGPQSLANNLNRVDHISEDSVVHGSEGSRAGTLLGLACAGAVGALWAGQDAAAGEEEDMAVGELLLEFAG